MLGRLATESVLLTRPWGVCVYVYTHARVLGVGGKNGEGQIKIFYHKSVEKVGNNY